MTRTTRVSEVSVAEIQVVEARDGLEFLGRVAVRTFGLNLLAVDEDLGTGAGRANFESGAVRDGQFDEKGKRSMVGCELDVQAEPGVATSGGWRRLARLRLRRRFVVAAGAVASSSGTSPMEGLASRTAHLESSKVGEDAARLDVMPMRQFLSRAMGDPRLVASKMAGAIAGAESLPRLRWMWGLVGVAEGFGDGGPA